MNTSDELDKIGAALVAGVATLDDIARQSTAKIPTKSGGEYGYNYADLATIMSAVRPALATAGLVVTQSTVPTDRGIGIVTRLWHSSGQWIESGPCVIPANGGPQDIGSALTYARRYSVLALLGLATEDDDGKAAQTAHHRHEERALADAEHEADVTRRAGIVFGELRALSPNHKAAAKEWADGRKLTVPAMVADEHWLEQVESWIDELVAPPGELIPDE